MSILKLIMVTHQHWTKCWIDEKWDLFVEIQTIWCANIIFNSTTRMLLLQGLDLGTSSSAAFMTALKQHYLMTYQVDWTNDQCCCFCRKNRLRIQHSGTAPLSWPEIWTQFGCEHEALYPPSQWTKLSDCSLFISLMHFRALLQKCAISLSLLCASLCTEAEHRSKGAIVCPQYAY